MMTIGLNKRYSINADDSMAFSDDRHKISHNFHVMRSSKVSLNSNKMKNTVFKCNVCLMFRSVFGETENPNKIEVPESLIINT